MRKSTLVTFKKGRKKLIKRFKSKSAAGRAKAAMRRFGWFSRKKRKSGRSGLFGF